MRMTRLTRPLILASASPRRANLLTQLGLTHRALPTQITEPMPGPREDVQAAVQRAAEMKALAAARALPATPLLVLAADTLVVLPTRLSEDAPRLGDTPAVVLGKPATAAEARRMLHLLAGRTHSVVTAVTLLSHPEGTLVTDVVTAQVQMRPLTAAEIDDYVASGEPLDKAGAYGIQGLGAVLIEGIVGDYYAVVGLPLAPLWARLQPWRTRR